MARVVGLDVLDVRFPTSRGSAGSDAMNPDPDHSAAYVVLRADRGPDGHGLVFTIGRGNDVQAAAIRALAPLVVGRAVPETAQDLAALVRDGYPAYTTSPGRLGHSDDELAEPARRAVADGFDMVKVKVGGPPADDVRRLRLVREVVGPDVRVAVDANQRWDVGTAVARVRELAPFDPYRVEEPTSPDDVLAHRAIARAVRPVKVATGEHVPNRVVFKQLLQADAVDVVQIDACRVGGVNENVAILLPAAKFGVPVCPHAGGVGLCELVRHLAMFDFVAVSGTTEGRAVEWVDHLHEHFTDPAEVRGGRYRAPTEPGFSARVKERSLAEFRYPDGPVWTNLEAR
ncbi:enolase C-terminal domain-like protein [Actinosynnema sp. NPDC059797]